MKKAIIAGIAVAVAVAHGAGAYDVRAFSLHDAAAPSIDAASSLRDRPAQSSCPFRR